MANNLNDPLIKHFKKLFTLSDFGSGLVQSAFYLGYFLCAIPAALFMQRFSYKAAVILGLVLYGAGALLFYPAGEMQSYGFFLAALFVIASGLAFLETSANPMVATLGPPEDSERRLNFAQSFNPLGSIAGVFIGRTFILSGIEYSPQQLQAMNPQAIAAWHGREAAAAETPYIVIGIGVLVWAVLIALTRFPAPAARHAEGIGNVGRFGELLRRGRYMFGVFAQFCYVGAQVGIWSYTIRYVQQELPGTSEKTAADLIIVALALFAAGRFTGTALMRFVAPLRLLAIFGLINIVLCAVGGDRRRRSRIRSAHAVELLHVDHVPDDLRRLDPRPWRSHQARLVADRDGDHRRRGLHRRDGPRLRCDGAHPLRNARAPGLLRCSRRLRDGDAPRAGSGTSAHMIDTHVHLWKLGPERLHAGRRPISSRFTATSRWRI